MSTARASRAPRTARPTGSTSAPRPGAGRCGHSGRCDWPLANRSRLGFARDSHDRASCAIAQPRSAACCGSGHARGVHAGPGPGFARSRMAGGGSSCRSAVRCGFTRRAPGPAADAHDTRRAWRAWRSRARSRTEFADRGMGGAGAHDGRRTAEGRRRPGRLIPISISRMLEARRAGRVRPRGSCAMAKLLP